MYLCRDSYVNGTSYTHYLHISLNHLFNVAIVAGTSSLHESIGQSTLYFLLTFPQYLPAITTWFTCKICSAIPTHAGTWKGKVDNSSWRNTGWFGNRSLQMNTFLFLLKILRLNWYSHLRYFWRIYVLQISTREVESLGNSWIGGWMDRQISWKELAGAVEAGLLGTSKIHKAGHQEGQAGTSQSGAELLPINEISSSRKAQLCS